MDIENIKRLIERGDFIEAKQEINKIEMILSEERSDRIRSSLIANLCFLKDYYYQKSFDPKIDLIPVDNTKVESVILTKESTPDNVRIKNINNQNIGMIDCKEFQLMDAYNITSDKITSKHSIQFINVSNSFFICYASQIRLINCDNIILKAFSQTGIYLQDSKNIVFEKSDENLNVHDFTDPINKSDYSFK